MVKKNLIKQFGLIGKNIDYSFSRTYFSSKFEKEKKVNHRYVNYDLNNINEFKEVLIKKPIPKGLNVTTPYKKEVIPFLDDLSEEAKTINAVNTIVWDANGKIIGHNTDHIGFEKSLNELRPLLVFIHGGYWQELSIKESFFPSTEAVKNDIGYAAIEYSLAPNVSVSEIVDECKEAIDWIFTNAANLGYDHKKIILSGSSAGAHLVAMCLLKINKFSPLGAVLVSGIYNIEPLIGTSIDEALSLTNSQAYKNSPINFSLENFPASIVI